MRIIEGFGSGYSSDEKAAKLNLNTLKAMTHEWWAPGKVVYLKQAPFGGKGNFNDKWNKITKEEYNKALTDTLTQVRDFIADKTQIRIDWGFNDVIDAGFNRLVLEEIAKSDSVKAVDLSFNRKENILTHLDALKNMPIEKLSIGDNCLFRTGKRLVEALDPFKPTLKHLLIHRCSLKEELVEVLVALKGFKALEEIFCFDNDPYYDPSSCQSYREDTELEKKMKMDVVNTFYNEVAAVLKTMPGIRFHVEYKIAKLAGAEAIRGGVLGYKIPTAADEGNVHEAMDGLALTAKASAPAEAAVEVLGAAAAAAGGFDAEGDLT